MAEDGQAPYHLTSIFTSRPVLLIAFCFLGAALLNHQDEMTLLLVLLFAMVGSAWIWSRYAFSNLDIEFTIDRTKVFPGETLALSMTLSNGKLLPVRVEILPFFDNAFFSGDSPAATSGFLLWYQKATFTWELTARKRGYLQMGEPYVTASDLFNFFPRKKRRSHGTPVLIFPKLKTIRPFSMPEQHFFGMPGEKSPVRDPVYILGTREYRYETPARHIQWKASARMGKLQEKICEPSVQEKILICVDVEGFCSARQPELFEQMLEAAAGMAVCFEQKGNAVGFLTNAGITGNGTGFIPLGHNSRNLSDILEALARMQMNSKKPFFETLQQYAGGLWGTNCLLLVYTPDAGTLKIQNALVPKRMPVQLIAATLENPGPEDRNVPCRVRTLDSLGI